MNLDKVVKDLFGHNRFTEAEKVVGSMDFIRKGIKDAPNTVSKYHEYTADRAIKDFLFEQTDLARELKKILGKYKYEPEEENS